MSQVAEFKHRKKQIAERVEEIVNSRYVQKLVQGGAGQSPPQRDSGDDYYMPVRHSPDLRKLRSSSRSPHRANRSPECPVFDQDRFEL